MLVYQRVLMFHGFNNVEFYDSLAASRCFGGAVLLGRPRFIEHVHAPCCRTSFISWLCLGKRNIHHDWGIQKRNLYESVLFCVILEPKKVSKSKLSNEKNHGLFVVRCSSNFPKFLPRSFPLNEAHILWIASRFFLVTRSIYVKWKCYRWDRGMG